LAVKYPVSLALAVWPVAEEALGRRLVVSEMDGSCLWHFMWKASRALESTERKVHFWLH